MPHIPPSCGCPCVWVFLLYLELSFPILKSRDNTLSTKVRLVKAMVFPVVMYGCESWTMKKAECWRIDAFELWCWRRLLRVPWTGKEIQPVHPKGDQFWIFIRSNGIEAETPILWPPDAKNWLIWNYTDTGTDWRQEEKGISSDEVSEDWYQRTDRLYWTEHFSTKYFQVVLAQASHKWKF